MAECYSWPYDPATNRPFDAVKLKADATYTPSDGKSWFGNVFGGGSGYYPFIKKVGNDTVSVWNPTAGSVRGNTNVTITGGHILTSVYGGNELYITPLCNSCNQRGDYFWVDTELVRVPSGQ